MPRYIEILQSDYSFTVWDFAAEFGGWVGVLWGLSILDIADVITGTVQFLSNILDKM